MFTILPCALWIFPLNSKERGDTASPKFIVTLDGVPSPLGILADCEMELDDVRPPTKVTEATVQVNREPKVSVLQRLQGVVTSSEGLGSWQSHSAKGFGFAGLFWSCSSCPYTFCSLLTDDVMDIDMLEEDAVPLKKQKVLERCKFWPVCKSGDECSYHHPTTQCKWVFLSGDGVMHHDWWFLCVFVFCFSGLFRTASLGINAFLFILIVNTTPGVASRSVPSLTSAAEAQLLLHPGQVCSEEHTLFSLSLTITLFRKMVSNLNLCVHSDAASAEYYCVSLLPRLQEDGVSVLSSKGKMMWRAVVEIWFCNSRVVVE